ncbi:MAG: hypothetical protein M3Z40_03860, partial [Bifidobacterium sp.]|nr:hypothetical protein [Bifidobacterium sp.]
IVEPLEQLLGAALDQVRFLVHKPPLAIWSRSPSQAGWRTPGKQPFLPQSGVIDLGSWVDQQAYQQK